MSDFNFKAINCCQCGHLVWDGLSASGFPTKLDTTRLNIVEELIKLSTNTRTYQIHRTSTSFEATRRTAIRMGAVDPVVLAEHTCTSSGFTFGQEAPEYFNRQIYPSSDKGTLTTTSEVPF
jgi:hypothetical protein